MQVEKPFKKAIVKKYPEQVVVVLVREEGGRVNPITIGWVMLTSHVPPMMAFSVGLKRYSLELLRKAGECVIAFPSEDQAEETLLFGTASGRDRDKLEDSAVITVPAKTVDCVLLNDAVANFECVIREEMQTGDHVIFAVEVLASHVNPDTPGRLYTVGTGFRMSGITVNNT